jgi:hypothetical protein
LFLKERSFGNSSSFDNRTIVGLIDDEPTLHLKWVYGHVVLGGAKDLPYLIQRHRLTGILITAALRPEALAAIQDVVARHNLSLSEWQFEIRTLAQAVPSPQRVAPAMDRKDGQNPTSPPQPSPEHMPSEKGPLVFKAVTGFHQ